MFIYSTKSELELSCCVYIIFIPSISEMLEFLSHLRKPVGRQKRVSIDSWITFLIYRVSTSVVLFAVFVTSSTFFIGKPISCLGDSQDYGSEGISSYCLSNHLVLPSNGESCTFTCYVREISHNATIIIRAREIL